MSTNDKRKKTVKQLHRLPFYDIIYCTRGCTLTINDTITYEIVLF